MVLTEVNAVLISEAGTRVFYTGYVCFCAVKLIALDELFIFIFVFMFVFVFGFLLMFKFGFMSVLSLFLIYSLSFLLIVNTFDSAGIIVSKDLLWFIFFMLGTSSALLMLIGWL